MGQVKVIYYKDDRGCPVSDWLKSLDKRAYAKGMAKVNRLGALGHELRRPEADYLRDGIYELRWRVQSVNYRILYFFHGREAVILAHGLTKENEVPKQDIETAVQRKTLYEMASELHKEKGTR